ncbi:MAG TPA: DUF2868 domain-containing protein [Paucimonas sp.]|nr:DUF2868 domain-containing protein [Paucimonas sp.]HJW54562.1 DUF2868 domain-containing protein [Burkholderiaceae bacterium]
MNEQVARDVILVRAIETADQKREILSEDDRMYASRSAKELAQWQAADTQSEMTMEHFLQQRSEQILKRIAERIPSFALFYKRRNGVITLMTWLPLLALLAGAGMDRISDPHRVDLLSAPLLLIIGWNLLVYAGILIWKILPPGRSGRPHAGLVRLLGASKAVLPRKLPHALANALLAFTQEWVQLSSRLATARVSRTIHLSAALFAVGAVLSLYARGFLSQYAAGWESTFLDAAQVHALLSALFMPAVAVFHLQDFSIAEIESLRFAQTPSSMGGARWVHLYAATLFLLVVLPRTLLVAAAHWRVRKLSKNFPLDLEQPYFRKLNQAIGGAAGILRVLPYSFTVDEARDKGLAAIATMLLGERARVMLRPSSAYGEEPQDALRDTALNDAGVALTAVLFNLAATPEKENHGAFLDYLVRESARGIAVLIDESGYLERVGTQGSGKARMAERIALWQQFCSFHQAPATIVNLIDPGAHPVDSGAGLILSAVS